MKLLVTGLHGLIGSRIRELLSDWELENLSRSEGVDITDTDAVERKILSSSSDVVIHLAGMTNVDECEREREKAWEINVEGTQNIAKACEKANKKLIYFSTDFVFDGTKEFYIEEDTPSPLNYYGVTKYEGEKIVQQSSSPWLILRISYPYTSRGEKKDFVRAILSRFREGEKVEGVTDQIITPTFIDDIVSGLVLLLQTSQSGYFHVTGSDSLTPFEAGGKIAQEFSCDTSLLSPVSREKFFKDRAPRPYKTIMKNDKITKLGLQMKTFGEGLEEIKNQL